MRPAEDGPDFAKGFYLILVIVWLGSSVMDVVPKVPITDEFLDLILEYDALLSGVADILVVPTILILISSGAVSSQRVRSLVNACLLGGLKDLFT